MLKPTSQINQFTPRKLTQAGWWQCVTLLWLMISHPVSFSRSCILQYWNPILEVPCPWRDTWEWRRCSGAGMGESGCPHWPHQTCFALEMGPLTGVSHWPAPSHMINMGGITGALKLHIIWTLHKCSLLQGDAELLLTDWQISSTLKLSEQVQLQGRNML